MTDLSRTYPHDVTCGDKQITIARMTSADRDRLIAFAAALPEHDLVFVPRDIRQPKVVDAWMRALDRGEIESLVALDGDRMIGCTAIVTDGLGWSRHVGELRALVLPEGRGIGLGRALIRECFMQAVALGLKKLVAQMTTHQRAAIAVFEEMSFRPEALLSNHVIGSNGEMHDLVVLSHDVEGAATRRATYGLSDAIA